jgi:chromosome segregation ATPase
MPSDNSEPTEGLKALEVAFAEATLRRDAAEAERVRDLTTVVAALERSARHAGEQAEAFRHQLQAAVRNAETHAARAAALEAMLAEFRHCATAEIETLRARAAHAAARIEAADIEQLAALARIATLSTQRDIAQAAARRAASAAEAHWRGQVATLEQRAQAAELQAAEWHRHATHWQRRFEGLHARLVRLLQRFGIMRAVLMVPQPLRRFARARLQGWDRK